MKVVLQTIAGLHARRSKIAELSFEHGDWITATEIAYNLGRRSSDDEQRYLIVDQYHGGGTQQPFGMHTVQFARYLPMDRRYEYDEPVMLQVER